MQEGNEGPDDTAPRSDPRATATIDERAFWRMLDETWRGIGGAGRALRAIADGSFGESQLVVLVDGLERFLPAIERRLAGLGPEDLIAFDRVLEAKLIELDHPVLWEHAGTDDPGFLGVRAFVVASGEACFRAIVEDPTLAVPELSCRSFAIAARVVYERRHGPMPRSGLSRSSRTNPRWWQDRAPRPG
jgi:hypothetical protein